MSKDTSLLSGSPSSKARYEGLLSQLADICIQYQEAETVLIRSTESTSSDEFKQAAVKVAGTIIAKAGQQLNGLDDALLKETSKA
jgi:major membrane immunogen (membrane-anchored lipoprotein)